MSKLARGGARPFRLDPYGGVASLTHGNGLVESCTTNTDNHVTAVKVQPVSGAAPLDRSMSWTGETLDGITDNQTQTYTPARRLATALGSYGSYTWTYDAVGNRSSEKLGTALSPYDYPTTSNRLASITSGSTVRRFTYDASADIATDSRTGALGLTYQYDEEGWLVTSGNSRRTEAWQSSSKRRLPTSTSGGAVPAEVGRSPGSHD